MSTFKEQARDAIVEKLKAGKRVGRCDMWDLIDCEINSDRYRSLLEDIGSLVLGGEFNDNEPRQRIAERVMNGLIERYLDTHEDLINELAAEFRHEYELEQAA